MFHNPAGERNKEPILDVLKQYYDADATIKVLEIASGIGTHVLHLANHFKQATFLPSECEKTWADAIDDAVRSSKAENVLPAALIDVAKSVHDWIPITRVDMPAGFRPPVDVI